MKNMIENAPALSLDRLLYYNHGRTIPVHVVRERRIVWNFLGHLMKHGILPRRVDDGDEVTAACSKKAVMELLFNLDEAHVYFNKGWVYFVLGNDTDVISDYSVDLDSVISKFNAEDYA